MKSPNHTSRLTESRSAGLHRPGRPKLCSCAEARVERKKAAAHKMGALNQLPKFEIPEPLRVDQNELCHALERAVLAGGRTGAAARKLRKLLQPHLLKEETDLLEILGLLLPLSRGEITPAMRQVPARTEHLQARMFEIVREHAAIIKAARRLLRAARTEHKLPLARFTEHLMLRAWTDEEVFYPAAILIGEHLKLRFAQGAAA